MTQHVIVYIPDNSKTLHYKSHYFNRLKYARKTSNHQKQIPLQIAVKD